MDKLLSDPKFLQKCKDLANDEKFSPVPSQLGEYWVVIMWLKGFERALNWAGYEIRKKDESTQK